MPFSDVSIVGEYLSLGDFLLAAIAAAVILWIIKLASLRVAVGRMTPEEFKNAYLNRIIQRCYMMFPQTTFSFAGKTFTRGMAIRVTMKDKRKFEGSLIDMSHENVICVLAESQISADILDNILEIIELNSEDRGADL